MLSNEAFAEKRRAFEQEVAEVQRLVQERRRELDSMAAAALNEVKEALIEIVTSIAEERGFNLVLPSSEVLFFSRSLDLTEEVLAKLDARLPQVQLSEVSAGDRLSAWRTPARSGAWIRSASSASCGRPLAAIGDLPEQHVSIVTAVPVLGCGSSGSNPQTKDDDA